MNNIADYNYQVTTGGRGYGKTYLDNKTICLSDKKINVGFKEKENLIKYLESLLTGKDVIDNFIVIGVKDLLERIKSGKYE